MTMPSPKKPWVRALFLGWVGTALIAVACWAPEPTGSEVDELVAPVEEAVTASSEAQTPSGEIQLPPTVEEIRAGTATPLEPKTSEELQSAPTFTPYTVRPDIKNRETVARTLEREYPPLLKDAGIGGTAHVWFFIDEDGRVVRTQVNRSTGHKALDDAAMRVASIIEFTPALNREKRVPVWISLPITFAVGEGEAVERSPRPPTPVVRADQERAELPPPPGAQNRSPEELAAAPTFTPYTVRPDITNRNDVARALQDSYPSALRDAGIGGTAQIWFFIDETGKVQRLQINQSAGHEELDAAALKVAALIEFTPALKDDQPVPVWISLPITFTTR